MFGITIENMKETGLIIKCTDMAGRNGLMAEFMMVIMKMIKNMVKELLFGLMEENILEVGKMENKMEEVSIICPKDRRK